MLHNLFHHRFLFFVSLIFSFVTLDGAAQIQFTQVLPPMNQPQNMLEFQGAAGGDSDFADIDGDGDLDVVISGRYHHVNIQLTELYLNDGMGNFTLVQNTSFPPVSNSDVEFFDADGDLDVDLIVSGAGDTGWFAELYYNDGNGNFTLSPNVFTVNASGEIVHADIDNDNDEDLLIVGSDNNSTYNAMLYLNNGSGIFTLASGTPFIGVWEATAEFADVDNDNDPDVLITGMDQASQYTARLYLNDGAGNYTYQSGTPFTGVRGGATSFVDIDGDNDYDLMVTGLDVTGSAIAEMYSNNGSGLFTQIVATPFLGVFSSALETCDIDGDSDMDLFISGKTDVTNGFLRYTRLYLNDGLGNFAHDTSNIYHATQAGTINSVDVDGDSDLDLLVNGQGWTGGDLSKLYINDGNTQFQLASQSTFDGVESGSVEFADVDGDNDQDIFIMGYNQNQVTISNLYINDGIGNYTASVPQFDSLGIGASDFADIDGDGDLDLLICGNQSYVGSSTKLYTNDGSGNFTYVPGTPFPPMTYGDLKFADLDGDNDQDLVLSGLTTSGMSTEIYLNDGAGNFTITLDNLVNLKSADINFADVDNDNDLDLLLNGGTTSNACYTRLYLNDGNGSFTWVSSAPFLNIAGDACFIDLDGDLDEDIVLTGNYLTIPYATRVYINDGLGNYTEDLTSILEPLANSFVTSADIDNDGDEDLLLCGRASDDFWKTNLYANNGVGDFTLISQAPFEMLIARDIQFGNANGDNYPDVLLTGTGHSQPVSKLYLNNSIICNTAQLVDSITACDSYTWLDDTTYTSSNNTSTFNLVNSVGCDSLISLDLTILYSSYLIDSMVVCDSLTWLDGNTYYASNNTATYTLQNSVGCDSVITLDLIVLGESFNTTIVNACESYYWAQTDVTYTNSGAYFDTLQTEYGCDSILILNLSVFGGQGPTETISSCDAYTWSQNGVNYVTSGIYTDTILGTNGCDSILLLDLTITQIDTSITGSGGILQSNQNNGYYQWIDCNNGNSLIIGANDQSYVLSSNGSYAVIVSVDGCLDTSSCFIVDNLTLDAIDLTEISVYPNPTYGNISIDLDQPYSNVVAEIMDGTGRLIQKEIRQDVSQFDVEIKGAEGIYFLYIDLNSGVPLIFKVIKNFK